MIIESRLMELKRFFLILVMVGLLVGQGAVFAENPLEELEAKLLDQAKSKSTKDAPSSKRPAVGPASEEPLPLPNKVPKPQGIEIQGLGDNSPKSPVPKISPPVEMESDPPYLGMTLEKPLGVDSGLQVVEVVDQSPAWKSGFRIGDRVIAVGGRSVSSIDSFASEMSQYQINSPVSFLIDRRGRQVELVAVLVPRSVALRLKNSPIVPPPTASNSPSSPRSLIEPKVPAVDGRGALGLGLAPLSEAFRRQFGIPVYRGASVLDVAKGSPAHAAGLAPGDCLVEIDTNTIFSDEDVLQWKRTAVANSVVSLGFYRGAQKLQTMLQVPSDGFNPGNAPAVGFDMRRVTPEMLTPEFVASLQSELIQTQAEMAALRSELAKVQTELERSKKSSGR
jgi:membrane-associated protease RseP (regulator of RpoE activity)